jgi:acyl-CoA reductase-like NAD-dependent aldehyde dehydrogenase
MSKSLYLRKRFFSSLNTASRIRCLDDIPWYNETLAFEFRPNCSTMSVYNPADPTFIVGNVPIRTRQDTKEAIERSYQAWTSDLSSWRDFVTPARRASLLTRWSNLIEERAQDIASLMTLESGKTLTESIAEIHYAKSFLDYYAAEAIRLGGKVLPVAFSEASRPRGQGMTLEQPIGVTALITPWNFPLAMITRKVAPALAAGCTVLIKPSERTPLSAIVIGQLAQEAGIPSDVIQVL